MRTIFESSSSIVVCPSFNYRDYKVRPLQPRDNLPAYHKAYQRRLAPFVIVGPRGIFVGLGENVDPWITFFPDEVIESGKKFSVYDKNLFERKRAIEWIDSSLKYKMFLINLISEEIEEREDYIIELKDGWTRTE